MGTLKIRNCLALAGALTAFAERFLVQMVMGPPHNAKFNREIVQAQLSRFDYDTAAVPNPIVPSATVKPVQ